MPGAIAPPRHSPRALIRVERGRRAEVDDHARAAVQVDRGHRVDDAVGADLLGVVGEDRHAGPDARLDDDRRHVAVVAAHHRAHLVQHRRHGRAQRDAVDVGTSHRGVWADEPVQHDASSSAVRRASVAMRQCSTRSSPSNRPSTVWVLPTSIASSIRRSSAAAGRGRCRGSARSGSGRRRRGSRRRSRRPLGRDRGSARRSPRSSSARRAMSTHRSMSRSDMLSRSTRSAPASTTTRTARQSRPRPRPARPGTPARTAAKASSTPPAAITWLSLTRAASDSDMRWLTPPPHRTAYFSSARSPGVVLRVSRITAPVPATASTQRRVSVAMPDRWDSRLSVVRSAVRSSRVGPSRSATPRPRATGRRPRHETTDHDVPVPASARTVSATTSPATTPSARATKSATASLVSGHGRHAGDVHAAGQVLGDGEPGDPLYVVGIEACLDQALSEIGGCHLSRSPSRSSLARRLGCSRVTCSFLRTSSRPVAAVQRADEVAAPRVVGVGIVLAPVAAPRLRRGAGRRRAGPLPR